MPSDNPDTIYCHTGKSVWPRARDVYKRQYLKIHRIYTLTKKTRGFTCL